MHHSMYSIAPPNNASDSCGDGVFSYRIGSSKYYIVNMPSLIQQVFAQRGNVLNKRSVLEWFMKTAFGDNFATRDEVRHSRATTARSTSC